ncbi:MAG: M56 family metallopeptidase [Chitinophagaceae bacterium]|nr:M56 family metallopeptidase [Chitinophagaceae bacterium]
MVQDFFLKLAISLIESILIFGILRIIYRLILFVGSPIFNPNLRCLLAFSLLVSGFCYFLFSLLFLSSENSGIFYSSFANPLFHFFENEKKLIFYVVSLCYLFFLLFSFFRLVRGYYYTVRIRSPKAKNEIHQFWFVILEKNIRLLNIRRRVSLWFCHHITVPLTVGIFRPVILLPVAAVNHLSVSQAEAVILHELAHIKRYDYLMNLIVHLIDSILYFNPFVKAFKNDIQTEREFACDDWVLRMKTSPVVYAEALLLIAKTCETEKGFWVKLSGQTNDLLRRVERLFQIPPKKKISYRALVSHAIVWVISIFTLQFFNEKKLDVQTFQSVSSAGLKHNIYIFNAPENFAFHKTEKNRTGKIKSEKRHFDTVYQPAELSFDMVNLSSPYPPLLPVDYKEENGEVQDSATARLAGEYTEKARAALENLQWQKTEESVADAFTEPEKEILRQYLSEQINKINWKEVELKIRYYLENNIANEFVERLHRAEKEMKINQLILEYQMALSKMKMLNDEMMAEQIPDNHKEIIELMQKQIQELDIRIQKLKAVKPRKTIRL